ncbi:MAG: hypothetical protein JWR32_3921 [Mycobacterium sp.]|jgi:hypothetical protein|nr:hypothetical protein [Mycobacterium sp.]
MTRTIQHGNRNGYASLGAGGLSQESFPMPPVRQGHGRRCAPAAEFTSRGLLGFEICDGGAGRLVALDRPRAAISRLLLTLRQVLACRA